MGPWEYLAILMFCALVTVPLEFVIGVRVYRQAKRLALALGCVAAVFVTWDLLGARLGHWDFNPRYVTGVRLFGLPVEEYLFFIVIPLCAILTYEATRMTLPSVSDWLRRRRPRRR